MEQLILTEREKRIFDILSRNQHWTTKYTVERKSDKDFDIIIEGEQGVEDNKPILCLDAFVYHFWCQLGR